ncbi:hypothetical protein cyc_08803 [Cyclospora cayetanensis]|uniref:Uncharacterized protein n=1 Tax=Cyclospora cayetanensis TaxID=88456 RepID=A0A1D3D4I3_9EIME|nr:hypothetical protein cyc_08803 [Cyclospora cayetanensis]
MQSPASPCRLDGEALMLQHALHLPVAVTPAESSAAARADLTVRLPSQAAGEASVVVTVSDCFGTFSTLHAYHTLHQQKQQAMHAMQEQELLFLSSVSAAAATTPATPPATPHASVEKVVQRSCCETQFIHPVSILCVEIDGLEALVASSCAIAETAGGTEDAYGGCSAAALDDPLWCGGVGGETRHSSGESVSSSCCCGSKGGNRRSSRRCFRRSSFPKRMNPAQEQQAEDAVGDAVLSEDAEAQRQLEQLARSSLVSLLQQASFASPQARKRGQLSSRSEQPCQTNKLFVDRLLLHMASGNSKRELQALRLLLHQAAVPTATCSSAALRPPHSSACPHCLQLYVTAALPPQFQRLEDEEAEAAAAAALQPLQAICCRRVSAPNFPAAEAVEAAAASTVGAGNPACAFQQQQQLQPPQQEEELCETLTVLLCLPRPVFLVSAAASSTPHANDAKTQVSRHQGWLVRSIESYDAQKRRFAAVPLGMPQAEGSHVVSRRFKVTLLQQQHRSPPKLPLLQSHFEASQPPLQLLLLGAIPLLPTPLHHWALSLQCSGCCVTFAHSAASGTEAATARGVAQYPFDALGFEAPALEAAAETLQVCIHRTTLSPLPPRAAAAAPRGSDTPSSLRAVEGTELALILRHLRARVQHPATLQSLQLLHSSRATLHVAFGEAARHFETAAAKAAVSLSPALLRVQPGSVAVGLLLQQQLSIHLDAVRLWRATAAASAAAAVFAPEERDVDRRRKTSVWRDQELCKETQEAAETLQQAPPQVPLLITNLLPVPLLLRQSGFGGSAPLPPGAARAAVWCMPPSHHRHNGSGSSNSGRKSSKNKRALQFALACGGGWSSPVFPAALADVSVDVAAPKSPAKQWEEDAFDWTATASSLGRLSLNASVVTAILPPEAALLSVSLACLPLPPPAAAASSSPAADTDGSFSTPLLLVSETETQRRLLRLPPRRQPSLLQWLKPSPLPEETHQQPFQAGFLLVPLSPAGDAFSCQMHQQKLLPRAQQQQGQAAVFCYTGGLETDCLDCSSRSSSSSSSSSGEAGPLMLRIRAALSVDNHTRSSVLLQLQHEPSEKTDELLLTPHSSLQLIDPSTPQLCTAAIHLVSAAALAGEGSVIAEEAQQSLDATLLSRRTIPLAAAELASLEAESDASSSAVRLSNGAAAASRSTFALDAQQLLLQVAPPLRVRSSLPFEVSLQFGAPAAAAAAVCRAQVSPSQFFVRAQRQEDDRHAAEEAACCCLDPLTAITLHALAAAACSSTTGALPQALLSHPQSPPLLLLNRTPFGLAVSESSKSSGKRKLLVERVAPFSAAHIATSLLQPFTVFSTTAASAAAEADIELAPSADAFEAATGETASLAAAQEGSPLVQPRQRAAAHAQSPTSIGSDSLFPAAVQPLPGQHKQQAAEETVFIQGNNSPLLQRALSKQTACRNSRCCRGAVASKEGVFLQLCALEDEDSEGGGSTEIYDGQGEGGVGSRARLPCVLRVAPFFFADSSAVENSCLPLCNSITPPSGSNFSSSNCLGSIRSRGQWSEPLLLRQAEDVETRLFVSRIPRTFAAEYAAAAATATTRSLHLETEREKGALSPSSSVSGHSAIRSAAVGAAAAERLTQLCVPCPLQQVEFLLRQRQAAAAAAFAAVEAAPTPDTTATAAAAVAAGSKPAASLVAAAAAAAAAADDVERVETAQLLRWGTSFAAAVSLLHSPLLQHQQLQATPTAVAGAPSETWGGRRLRACSIAELTVSACHFCVSVELEGTAALADVSSCSVYFPALLLRHLHAPPSLLQRELLAHYTALVLLQTPQILVSARALGSIRASLQHAVAAARTVYVQPTAIGAVAAHAVAAALVPIGSLAAALRHLLPSFPLRELVLQQRDQQQIIKTAAKALMGAVALPLHALLAALSTVSSACAPILVDAIEQQQHPFCCSVCNTLLLQQRRHQHMLLEHASEAARGMLQPDRIEALLQQQLRQQLPREGEGRCRASSDGTRLLPVILLQNAFSSDTTGSSAHCRKNLLVAYVAPPLICGVVLPDEGVAELSAEAATTALVAASSCRSHIASSSENALYPKQQPLSLRVERMPLSEVTLAAAAAAAFCFSSSTSKRIMLPPVEAQAAAAAAAALQQHHQQMGMSAADATYSLMSVGRGAAAFPRVWIFTADADRLEEILRIYGSCGSRHTP